MSVATISPAKVAKSAKVAAPVVTVAKVEALAGEALLAAVEALRKSS